MSDLLNLRQRVLGITKAYHRALCEVADLADELLGPDDPHSAELNALALGAQSEMHAAELAADRATRAALACRYRQQGATPEQAQEAVSLLVVRQRAAAGRCR